MSAEETKPTATPAKRAVAQILLSNLPSIVAALVVLAAIIEMVAPTWSDLSLWGGHDWDEAGTQRLFPLRSLLKYHQFPFWNPYACGGHVSWGNIQGAPNLISPFLPAYLLADMRVALRIEMVGTILLAAVGAWLWASRFTKSAALKALAAVLFAMNGRWAYQANTGHMMHFYYCWMPFTFYFFELACERVELGMAIRRRDLLLVAGTISLMVYNCGIYPLPHTAAFLGMYGLIRSVFSRRLYPLVLSVVTTVMGVALSAPKLLPTVENLIRFPRIVESTETFDLNAFIQMLTAKGQSVTVPARVTQWGWHEYGMYLGWVPFVLLIVALVGTTSPRERALSWIGVLGVFLGFGAFHPYSPWTLLHKLPVFSSQHVPSRWMSAAILPLAVMAAAVFERRLALCGKARKWIEWAAILVVAFVAFDIAGESSAVLKGTFWRRYSSNHPAGDFYTTENPEPTLRYEGSDWAPELIPSTKANVGVISCTVHAGQAFWVEKNSRGRVLGIGAYGKGEPRYRGETYIVGGQGNARIAKWTPNEVTVEVSDASPGSTLVLNQNWAPGWRANGKEALAHEDAVGTLLSAGNSTVVFRFRSPTTWWGLLAFTLLLAAMQWGWRFVPSRWRGATEKQSATPA